MTTTQNRPDLSNMSVAQVAIEFPASISVLNRHKLDYCCGGKNALADACKIAGLSLESIKMEINEEVEKNQHVHVDGFDSWSTDRLLDYIEQHHHNYVRSKTGELQGLLHKVCNAHGEEHSFLWDVKERFCILVQELLSHMEKEEKVLFPAIQRLIYEDSGFHASTASHPLDHPIAVMEHEHDDAGEIVKFIRKATNEYQPPAYACPTFRMAYALLKEFDEHLTEHIHLENNILFERVKSHEIL